MTEQTPRPCRPKKTGRLPPQLAALRTLKRLELPGNTLTGPMPAAILRELTRLRQARRRRGLRWFVSSRLSLSLVVAAVGQTTRKKNATTRRRTSHEHRTHPIRSHNSARARHLVGLLLSRAVTASSTSEATS
jgi:hypothetical protein